MAFPIQLFHSKLRNKTNVMTWIQYRLLNYIYIFITVNVIKFNQQKSNTREIFTQKYQKNLMNPLLKQRIN